VIVDHEWPAVGPAFEIDGFIEPMEWGSSTYTVIRVPDALVAAATIARTRRVGGLLDDVPVNLAITKAPVIDSGFVWAGASLLRRMRLEVGDPVRGSLSPVDPDHVPVPADLTEALQRHDMRDAWEALAPAVRRRRLVPVESAVTAATRERRISALLDQLTLGG
jgi:hypothetical protein